MKSKFIKILTVFVICLFSLIFYGCANSSKGTIGLLHNAINKTTSVLNNLETINNDGLIIEDFMNEDNLINYNINKEEIYNTNNKLDLYMLKITNLNNSITETININNHIDNLIFEIFNNCSSIKRIEIKEFNESLKQNIIENIDTLQVNLTRLNMTRNEIKNYYNNVLKEKNSYSNKIEYVSSKYDKLKSSLQSRYSYLINIKETLQNIYCYLCNHNTIYSTNIDEVIETGIKKNIDTYENAGTNLYGDYRNEMNKYLNNYYKFIMPGYGMNNGMNPYTNNQNNPYINNPYYNYNFGNIPYNGFTSPYNNGNYNQINPNINSFGIYNNIDSYFSSKYFNNQNK